MENIFPYCVLIIFQLPGNHFNRVPSMLDAGTPDTVSKTCEVKGSM